MQWLNKVYGTSQNQGDLPDPLEILSRYTPQVLLAAKRCLSFLEAIDWKWDLITVLKQPDELMDAVMDLRMIGEAIRSEEKKAHPQSHE